MSVAGGPGSFFTVSLDFELFWGIRDARSLAQYGPRILGERTAIPAMLALFREFGVRATWATVGFVSFAERRELLAYLPSVRPRYPDPRLDPYAALETIGANEDEDPYHYGYSLVRRVMDTPGMELGSHTFSHFFCLEPQEDDRAFAADLEASRAAFARLGVVPDSLVFPRNQYAERDLRTAAAAGFSVFRGNGDSRLSEPRNRAGDHAWRRLGRLADAYCNLTGANACRVRQSATGLVDVPASRFLRPHAPALAALDGMRLQRILRSMDEAARMGLGYHLWWHPHNFGADLAENLAFLRQVLLQFDRLRERHGMRPMTMSEAAGAFGGAPAT